MTWEMSNDPKDPCPYCVQWRAVEGTEDGEHEPYWPDGSVPARIFGGTHRECDEAVAHYMAEHGGSP